MTTPNLTRRHFLPAAATLADGICKLHYRKEKRGGQDWTAASMWTQEQFHYGYFECRYRYGAASGTNNSFWIFTRTRPHRALAIPHAFPATFFRRSWGSSLGREADHSGRCLPKD